MFGKRKKEKELNNILGMSLNRIADLSDYCFTQVIWCNPMVDICTKACAICWDKPIPKVYKDKMKYLSNRAITGHTSIFEHSNLVMYMELSAKYFENLITVLSSTRYLETSIKIDDGVFYVLIGGSLAGYRYLLDNIDDTPANNRVLKIIINNLYNNAPSCAFETLIKDEILDRSLFKDNDEDFYLDDYPHKRDIDVSDHIYIEHIDIPLDFLNKFINSCPKWYLFSMMDLIKMMTCTVLFKDISRTATHQLVRHRNAITQESQRYVDYSDALFANPVTFKPDKYDKDRKYMIEFGGQSFEMTLDQIGLAEQGIYKQLRDPSHCGADGVLLKEDARAFLPSNIICKKLYMTFTFKNLFKFLELRENPHAQAEIRLAAIELGKYIRNYLSDLFGDKFGDIYKFTEPFYRIKDEISTIADLCDIDLNDNKKDIDNWVTVAEEIIAKEDFEEK